MKLKLCNRCLLMNPWCFFRRGEPQQREVYAFKKECERELTEIFLLKCTQVFCTLYTKWFHIKDIQPWWSVMVNRKCSIPGSVWSKLDWVVKQTRQIRAYSQWETNIFPSSNDLIWQLANQAIGQNKPLTGSAKGTSLIAKLSSSAVVRHLL